MAISAPSSSFITRVQKSGMSVMEFPSIASFQDYFRTHSSLEVPRSLIIRRASILKTRLFVEEIEDSPNVIAKVSAMVTQLLLPLAKTAVIKLSEDSRLDYNCEPKDRNNTSDRFYIQSSHGFVITTAQENISTQLVTLFQMMDFTHVYNFELGLDQDFTIFGLTEEMMSSKDILLCITANLPPMAEWNIKLGRKVSKFTHQNPVSPLHKYSITFHSPGPMQLISIDPFRFTGKGFQEFMLSKGELEIPQGQTLTLVVQNIFEAVVCKENYNKFPFDCSFPFFFLNCCMFPYGNLDIEEEGKVNFALFNDHFRLSNPRGRLKFKLKKDFIITDLVSLNNSMIMNRMLSFKVIPDQELKIYDLKDSELKEFQTGKVSYDFIQKFLLRRNPEGYRWTLISKLPLILKNATSLRKNGEKFNYLIVQSNGNIRLQLQPVNGEELVHNLLLNAHPDLKEGLKDRDPNALILILVKALFYYCCKDFRLSIGEKLPEFFKEATQDKVLFLIKDSKEFDKAIFKINNDPKLLAQILFIVEKMSPDEFEKIQLDKLPPPIALILKELLNIVYSELQGSPFLIQCLNNID